MGGEPSWREPVSRAAREASHRLERHRAAITIALAGALALLTGFALAWSPWWLLLNTVAFALAALIARSLFRAMAAVLAAIGIGSAILWLLISLWGSAAHVLHLTWPAMAVAVWLVALVIAVIWRKADSEPSYSLVEALGALVGCAFAIRMYLSIDFRDDLLRFLVHVEDNAAWVGLTRDVALADNAGVGVHGNLGPSVPTLLGLLSAFQGSGVPLFNATFAAYAAAVFALPVVVAGLFVGRLAQPRWFIAAMFLLAVVWAYRVPFLLFASYGHLSAIWAVVALLALAGAVMRVRRAPVTVPLLMGLALLVGTLWFPIAGLAAVGVIAVAVWVWPRAGRQSRIGIAAGAIASAYVLIRQVPIDSVSADGGAGGAMKVLYAAQGGTASLDPIVVVLLLGGVLGLGWLARPSREELQRLWFASVVAVGFTVVVFGGSYFLRIGIGYGPTKVLFVVGSALLVALIAVIPRLPVPGPRAAVSVLVVLAFGGMLYGGGSDVLSRAWPGDPDPPEWLQPLNRVVSEVGPDSPAPIACVASGKWSAYLCTRWAAALTASDDGAFMGYRQAIAGDADPDPAVLTVQQSGVLGTADVLVLEWPSSSRRWAWTLIEDSNRVFGPDGHPAQPHPPAS